MPIFRVTQSNLERVPETSFASEKLLERRDLQRLLRADISVLGEDLMVVSEEFGDFEGSQRRIDLLCLDRAANLVVVELKRTEDGGHMELQAIRYASMVSSMTLERAIAAHARLLEGDDAEQRAQHAILDFLDLDSVGDGELTGDVRIILVAADFSSELTTSVLWLNRHELDLRCVRLKPYRLAGDILLDVVQIIPLPEAEDFEVKVREHAQETRKVLSSRGELMRRFWAQLIARSSSKTRLLANRGTTKDHWLSAGVGRAGFSLSVILLRDEARVELFVRNGDEAQTLAAFRALEAQKTQIETAFGGSLDWHDLPGRLGCRVCKELEGGWNLPESEWPEMQDRMIDALIRLDVAVRGPVQLLKA